jgi:phosphoribosyl 1,2-cyclic phosphodiesterase
MKVRFRGVRGSLPSPLLPEQVESRARNLLELFVAGGKRSPTDIDPFLKTLRPEQLGGFGGNTPCIEVESQSGSTRVFIDAGSGIRMAGYDLLNGPCGQGKGEVHILFTHFHWDHLIGLPFFTPIFIPGNEIHVYAVQPELPEVFRTVFKKPYFPLNLEQLGAKIHYHRLEPRAPARIGELTFTPYQLDHPDPCWGYKFEADGRKFSYCVDTEATRVTREEMGPDLPLYQDLDLLVFDAQYTLMEAIEKVNWGHAAAAIGIDIALREKVKKVLFMHHDPASSDSKIAAAREQTERYLETQNKGAKRSGLEGHALEWDYAREGLVTDLKEPTS